MLRLMRKARASSSSLPMEEAVRTWELCSPVLTEKFHRKTLTTFITTALTLMGRILWISPQRKPTMRQPSLVCVTTPSLTHIPPLTKHLSLCFAPASMDMSSPPSKLPTSLVWKPQDGKHPKCLLHQVVTGKPTCGASSNDLPTSIQTRNIPLSNTSIQVLAISMCPRSSLLGSTIVRNSPNLGSLWCNLTL